VRVAEGCARATYVLRHKFEAWNIPLPGADRELVYAPLGTPEADAYLDDMEKSAYSVNHGAGRCMGRKAAERALDQKTVDDEFTTRDILTNCRQYPKDEAPAAYKDFDAVLDSVKAAGLASEVARLNARFVIKDADSSLRGAA
jgi:RNA-splicing ligase RtcB